MKVLEDINVNGSGNFDNELTATSLSLTTSLFLQGFELKSHSLDDSTPDRLMYDGYVLLDAHNYREYLDSSYVKKSGDTMTGQLTVPNLTVSGNQLDITNGKLLLNRAGTNYIWGTGESGSIVFGLSSVGVTSPQNATLYIKSNSVTPGTRNNTVSLGEYSYRWSNVYSVLGNFSGQITSSVADGTAPFVVASKTLVSNLNADMLDGKHLSDVVHSYPDWSLSQYNKGEWAKFFEFSHAASDFGAYVVIDFFNYESGAKHVFGRLHMTARATALYSADVANWGREKCPQIKITSDDGLTFSAWMKIVKSGWHPYLKFNLVNKQHLTYSTTVTFQDEEPTGTNTNYTVIEGGFARKLSTPVTLWGQSFDGSGNVSGALSGVTSITGVSGTDFALKNNGSIQLRYNDNDASSVVLNRVQFKPFDVANGLLDLGSTSARWKGIYGQRLDVSGNATVGGTFDVTGLSTFRNDILYNSSDATLKIYDVDVDSDNFGNEAVAIQTCFDHTDPETSDYVTRYEGRCNLLLQPRGGQVYVGYTPTSAQSPYALSVGQAIRLYGDANSTNNPQILFYRDGLSSWKIINNGGNLHVQNNYTTEVQSSYFDVLKLNYNSGNTTLKGSLTTGGNILPNSSGAGNVGTSSAKWLNGYINNLYTETVRANTIYLDGASAATQDWVNSQSFAKASELNNYLQLTASTAQTVEGMVYFDQAYFNQKPFVNTEQGSSMVATMSDIPVVSFTQFLDEGVEIGRLDIGTQQYMLYAPSSSGSVDLTSVASDIIPDGNLTRKIGSSSNRWSLLYVNSINAGTIIPRTDNGWDLGATAFRWRNLYAVDGHLDSLTIGGETAATQSYVTSQLSSYATTSALSNYVTLDGEQTITERKTFSKGIIGGLHSIEAPNSVFVGLDSTVRVFGGLTVQTGEFSSSSIVTDEIASKSGPILGVNSDLETYYNIRGYSDDNCTWEIGIDGDMTIQTINGYKPLTVGNTSFTSTYTGGIAIGTIKIGNVVKTIYAPSASGGSDLSYITQDVTISVNPEDIDQASFRLYFGDGGNIFGMYTDDGRELYLDADVVYAAMVGVLHTEVLRCYEVIQMSDIRYKDIKESVHLELSDIAAAPTFRFNWKDKDNKKNYVGSSAQYWQSLVEEFVVEDKKTGKLGLDYSTAALVSAISIARELESAKLEILELKDKISALEGRIV